MALSSEAAEQLCDSSQWSDLFDWGGSVGQPPHMHSRGLEGMGPSCIEQLMAEGDGGGHELAKADPETSRLVRLVSLSNIP